MSEETKRTIVRKVYWWRASLAGWLSRAAAWLRQEEWYVADNWASVPGNRAAELQQGIWERCVLLSVPPTDMDMDTLNEIERRLTELSQLANAAWGHVQPKDRRDNL